MLSRNKTGEFAIENIQTGYYTAEDCSRPAQQLSQCQVIKPAKLMLAQHQQEPMTADKVALNDLPYMVNFCD